MISMIENFYHGRTQKVTWRCQVQTYLRKKRNWRGKIKRSFEYLHIPSVTLLLGRCFRSKQMIMASGRPSNFLDPKVIGKQEFLGRSPTGRG